MKLDLESWRGVAVTGGGEQLVLATCRHKLDIVDKCRYLLKALHLLSVCSWCRRSCLGCVSLLSSLVLTSRSRREVSRLHVQSGSSSRSASRQLVIAPVSTS